MKRRPKYGPDTVVRITCECGQKEKLKLKDISATPKGYFILPSTMQCIDCLRTVDVCVYEEDQHG